MTIATTGCAVDADKPRVISELRKNSHHRKRLPSQISSDRNGPKIAGELLWSATPTQWHVKLAEVRQGSLIIHCCSTGAAEFRLPLHHLSITANHTPRTFTLATSHGIPLATFQTLTEEEYRRWVRVLAVEVLRQTPLQDVRFLDIIGIAQSEERRMRRGQSVECLHQATHQKPVNINEDNTRKKDRTEFSQWLHCVKRETEEENRAKNTDFDIKNMKIRRAQKTRPKLPFADTWNKLRGHIDNKMSSHATTKLQKRSVSMDNVSKPQTIPIGKTNFVQTTKIPVSDESGISSGEENPIQSDSSTQSSQSTAEAIYVSVREKKKFFESLSNDIDVKKPEVTLHRSSSIGNFDAGQSTLIKSQRASSMHDLSSNALPVRQIRRLFESGSASDLTRSVDELRDNNGVSTTIIEEDDDGDIESSVKQPIFVNPLERKAKETVNYANIQFCRGPSSISKLPDRNNNQITQKINVNEKHEMKIRGSTLLEEGRKIINKNVEVADRPSSTASDTSSGMSQNDPATNMTTLLIQRKLQRGERKLCKLRIQIAEVEDTIKNIADDLQSIGPNTLKRRSGLEIFAALRRRLEEETSRLERLQEETAKVISDNQRTIRRM